MAEATSTSDMTGAIQALTDSVSNSFKGLADSLKQLTAPIEKTAAATKAATGSFAQAAIGITALGASVYGLARAGFSATDEGNKLSYVWTLFTRQIAAVALPVMHFLIEKLTALTDWFRSLSGSGQDMLLMVGGLAAIFLALVPVISVLSAVLSPIALAIAGIVAALYLFFTETEIGRQIFAAIADAVQWMISKWEDLLDILHLVKFTIGVAIDSVSAVMVGFIAGIAQIIANILDWIPGLGDAAEAVQAFADKGKKAYDSLWDSANKEFSPRERKKPGEGRRDVNPSGFSFESLSASFERITSAANKTDLAKETLNVQKAQLEEQKRMVEVLNKKETGGGDFVGH